MGNWLTYLLLPASIGLGVLWVLEIRKHDASRRQLTAQARHRHARLAGAMIRLRHAFISELFNSETMPPEQLLKEAMETARILSDCDEILDKVTETLAQTDAEPDISAHLARIQGFVEKCSAFRDSFFRDTTLFYVAGLLDYGGRTEEANFLRGALKHGTLRAKAAQASIMLLTPPLPQAVREDTAPDSLLTRFPFRIFS